METISADEFKKRYGELAYSKFTGSSQPKTGEGQFSGTQERLSDVGQSTANTISQALTGTGEFSDNSLLNRSVSATAAGFSAVPRGAYAMAPKTVRSGIDWAGEQIGKGFKALTGAIGGTKFMQEAAGHQTYDPATGAYGYQANDLSKLEDTLGTVAAAGEIAGTITGAEGVATTLTKAGAYTNSAARAAMRASDDALAKVKAKTPTVTSGNFFSNAVNDARFNISDIDPQVETILKRSNFDEVNTYFQQAQAAAKNPAKNTPLEIAGNKAESAFDAIDEARKKAIQGKKTILGQVADERVSGNTLNEVMSSGIQRAGEKFGVKISANGEVSPIKGRTSTLDANDAKLVSEYYSKLNSLGVSPTVKQVDDFVDWAQGQLYKQSKTVSKLEAASDPVIRELQATTGDLNGRLKATVGNGYGEVNARVSTLIELQDELSRALGADARKGGGLMKTLFSPTGGNTRRVFQQIYDETGIDLFKEATLAKYAMESVGDVRQASLLKQLDVVVQDAAELDLTKPMSIVKWLRERGDMDGQELANEIIRRQNLDSAQNPTKAKTINQNTNVIEKGLTKDQEIKLQQLSESLNVSSQSSVPDYLKNNKQAGFVNLTGDIRGRVSPESVAKLLDDETFDAVTLIIEDIQSARLNPAVNRFLDDMKLSKGSDSEVVKFLKEATNEYERLNT